MRFIPRVKIIQKDLDLSIVNVEKIIDNLLHTKSLGYVTFSFGDNEEALILIEKGETRDHLFFSTEKYLRGREAKDEIFERNNRGNGSLDIIELTENAFNALIPLFYGESYFGVLNSSYLHFEGFLEQIRLDNLHGSLTLDTEKENIIIYFLEGKPKSIYFRGYKIRKGSKKEIRNLVTNEEVRLEFLTYPRETEKANKARHTIIEGKKETLYLQRVNQEGHIWFEDQYGNRYKKSQIKSLWDKYHLIL